MDVVIARPQKLVGGDDNPFGGNLHNIEAVVDKRIQQHMQSR